MMLTMCDRLQQQHSGGRFPRPLRTAWESDGLLKIDGVERFEEFAVGLCQRRFQLVVGNGKSFSPAGSVVSPRDRAVNISRSCTIWFSRFRISWSSSRALFS